jgi:transcriptional regulator GlxA family with amidase domain
MDAVCQWTTSVCSGSIILAKAGLLSRRNCTTHWKRKDQLRQYDVRSVLDQRYVEDGKYISSAGVSAGIDMALFLASKILGDEGAKTIQRGIEYDHEWRK